MADTAKLAPLFAKLAEAAQEISDVFAAAGGVTLGKRGPGELDANGRPIKKKKERAPRAPTAFNMFMKKAVAEMKEAAARDPTNNGADLNPKEVFAQCAAKWKTAPENPKASQQVGSLAGRSRRSSTLSGSRSPSGSPESERTEGGYMPRGECRRAACVA